MNNIIRKLWLKIKPPRIYVGEDWWVINEAKSPLKINIISIEGNIVTVYIRGNGHQTHFMHQINWVRRCTE